MSTQLRNQLHPSWHYEVTTTTEEFRGVLVGLYTNLDNRHFALFRRWVDGRPRRVPLSSVTRIHRINRWGVTVNPDGPEPEPGPKDLPWAS
jgi:hypothetical protein